MEWLTIGAPMGIARPITLGTPFTSTCGCDRAGGIRATHRLARQPPVSLPAHLSVNWSRQPWRSSEATFGMCRAQFSAVEQRPKKHCKLRAIQRHSAQLSKVRGNGTVKHRITQDPKSNSVNDLTCGTRASRTCSACKLMMECVYDCFRSDSA